MIPELYITLAQQIAQRFKAYDAVEAVAIGGSLAAGDATDLSDMDLYVYLTRDLTPQEREAVIAPYASRWEHNDFWGPGDVFFDAQTGLEVDVVYFSSAWMTDQMARVLERHEASMGYTTAFWHTVRQSHLIYDRTGWFAGLYATAQQGYPLPLAHAVVSLNYPLLAESASSYRKQIRSAVARGDLVSLNHRVAAVFASYFDIVLAVNHVPHPGEKRLIEKTQRLCHSLPEAFEEDVRRVLALAAQPHDDLLAALDVLIAHLTAWLHREGYSVA